MRHILRVLTVGAIGLTMAGCSTMVQPPIPTPPSMPALLKLDGTNLSKACVRVGVAVKWFNNLSFLIPEPYRTEGTIAVSSVSDLCSPGAQAALLKSGQSIVAVITKLDVIWQKVQVNTKAS